MIDVTAPGRSRRGVPGVALHLPRQLKPDDKAVCDGIPVTSVARTLLDLAGVVDERRLARAWENAKRLRLPDVRAVQRLLEAHQNARGTKALRALIREQIEPEPSRSDFEALFLDLCRRHGLDPPSANALVEGFEVDSAWRNHKLVVELDSYAFHGTRAAFERDRHRDEILQLAGYRVLRLTHRRLEGEPEAVAGAVRKLLNA